MRLFSVFIFAKVYFAGEQKRTKKELVRYVKFIQLIIKYMNFIEWIRALIFRRPVLRFVLQLLRLTADRDKMNKERAKRLFSSHSLKN